MPKQLSPEVLAKYQDFKLANKLTIGENLISYGEPVPSTRSPKAKGNQWIVERHPDAGFSTPADKMHPPVPVNWPVNDGLSGVSSAVGLRGAGKTIFVSGLDVSSIIRLGEPGEAIDLDDRVIHVDNVQDAIFLAVFLSTQGEKVAIDGSRQLVFAASGNATAAGVSSGLYMTVTNIATFCNKHGVHIVITLNPMVKPAELENIFQNITASGTGGWLIEGGVVVEETHRLASGRVFGSGSISASNSERPAPALGSSMLSTIGSASEPPLMPTLQVFGPTPDPLDEDDDLIQKGRSGIVFSFIDDAKE